MDAGRITPRSAWAVPCLPCSPPVRRRAEADRDCDVSVLFALKRVPSGNCLPGAGPRRAVRHRPRYGVVAVAVPTPQFGGRTEESALGLRMVPDAVELRDAGRATQNPARG